MTANVNEIRSHGVVDREVAPIGEAQTDVKTAKHLISRRGQPAVITNFQHGSNLFAEAMRTNGAKENLQPLDIAFEARRQLEQNRAERLTQKLRPREEEIERSLGF